ncbi:hypothetical protein RJ640_027835 [Escallonia rubra]|uniref:Glycoside hydrolase family 19 catalytic domain-containing protein n=1 Tax=Escallonia rubra TaxID=112253 RepID=A0AA88RTZ1_9ASTE|nr:hypothetical protein RJ640_027835 [Escallonia rubra]
MMFWAVALLCFSSILLGAFAQGDLGSVVSKTTFEQMLKHRNDANCPANGFYTYEAFIPAAKSFGAFGTTGSTDARKREIAAFLAQTSHETTGNLSFHEHPYSLILRRDDIGGWASAPDGPYAWGYCFKQEQGNPVDYCVPNQQWPCTPGKKYFGRGPIQISYGHVLLAKNTLVEVPSKFRISSRSTLIYYAWGYCFKQEQGNPVDYCVPNQQWPCTPGKKYFGRGPIQISYNYNYGPAGAAIGANILRNPDLVATDPTISFKTALWFWMTSQSPKPSCHDVITGRWTPCSTDTAAGRLPGFGVVTNIINGGIECGKGRNTQVEDRIGFYKRYSDILEVAKVSTMLASAAILSSYEGQHLLISAAP